MHIIKVLATDSTNLFLRELYRETPEMGNCVVVTENQTRGKGQMGASWVSEPGKNLTFSLLLTRLKLDLQEQFKLSAIVALAVKEALVNQGIENIAIKWPNDILADNHKVCGILIENILQAGRIEDSIIGIGLNVNQTNFGNFSQASSLKSITGKDYGVQDLMETIAEKVETEVLAKLNLSLSTILKEYQTHLFRWQKVSTFQFPNGEQKTGIIQEITPQGRLQILFENHQLMDFDIKEIKLLY